MSELFYVEDEIAHVQRVTEFVKRVTSMLNSFIEFMKEYCRRLVELAAECIAAMKSTGAVNDDGKLVDRKNSRPAWASPYGPKPKRTRR